MSELVVVTGAAGALGRAVVAEFRERGAAVVAFDVPGEALTQVAEADENVHPVPVDLTNAAAVADAWSEVDSIGTPTALVCIAGGFAGGSLAELSPQTLGLMLDSNVATTAWAIKYAAERMRAAGGGAVVNVGSRSAVAGSAPVAYAAAKAAVVRLTEVLADELRRDHIRVNAVLPSVIDTPANRSWMSAEAIERAVPAEAVAKVIGFLCGPDAWPISGAAVPVYGDA